jgi:hypothetical protein
MTTPTDTRPVAVVTGTSSGIGYQRAGMENTRVGQAKKDDPAAAALHGKLSEPGSGTR